MFCDNICDIAIAIAKKKHSCQNYFAIAQLATSQTLIFAIRCPFKVTIACTASAS